MEINMNLLRMTALILTLSGSLICSIPGFAQQDVAPEHFDGPQAILTHTRVHGAPDKRTLVTGNDYRTLMLWDAGSGKLRGTLMTFPAGQVGGGAGEWAAFTPDGYYDGSPRADRILAWYADKGLRTAERLKLRRPDLLEESIRGR